MSNTQMQSALTRIAASRERIRRHLYRAMHHILDGMEPPRRRSAKDPALAPVLRDAADLLELWRLCERRACKRARCCRRASSNCVARYGPLVPASLRAGLLAQLKARRRLLAQSRAEL